MKDATGSWYSVFVVSAAGNLFVVVAALTLLRPLHRLHDRSMASRIPPGRLAAVAVAAE